MVINLPTPSDLRGGNLANGANVKFQIRVFIMDGSFHSEDPATLPLKPPLNPQGIKT